MATEERATSSDGSSHSGAEKAATEHIEQIKTNERVPGHTNYYEKDGLRTYGDDEGRYRCPSRNATAPTDTLRSRP